MSLTFKLSNYKSSCHSRRQGLPCRSLQRKYKPAPKVAQFDRCPRPSVFLLAIHLFGHRVWGPAVEIKAVAKSSARPCRCRVGPWARQIISHSVTSQKTKNISTTLRNSSSHRFSHYTSKRSPKAAAAAQQQILLEVNVEICRHLALVFVSRSKNLRAA